MIALNSEVGHLILALDSDGDDSAEPQFQGQAIYSGGLIPSEKGPQSRMHNSRIDARMRQHMPDYDTSDFCLVVMAGPTLSSAVALADEGATRARSVATSIRTTEI